MSSITIYQPTGDKAVDTANLQHGLDNYDCVKIESEYIHNGLNVNRAGQIIDCSGGNLIPGNIDAEIAINAVDVAAHNLKIHTTVAAERLLHINASGSVFHNLQINANNAVDAVEITNATGTKFFGGNIKGNLGTKTQNSAGLKIGELGGYEVKLFGTTIHHWEVGLKITSPGSIDDLFLSGCNLENNSIHGIHFHPDSIGVIYNLTIIGSHFEGSPTYLNIGENGRILSGLITSNRFSGESTIIRSYGGLQGITVCNNYAKTSTTGVVYDLNGVQVLHVYNSNNIWNGYDLATGSMANHLISVDALAVMVV